MTVVSRATPASICGTPPPRRIDAPGLDRSRGRLERPCGSTLRNRLAACRLLTQARSATLWGSDDRFGLRPLSAPTFLSAHWMILIGHTMRIIVLLSGWDITDGRVGCNTAP